MLKSFLGIAVGVIGMVGVANATLVSTGPASYGTAEHGTTQWQRLGNTNSNDGVTWSVNGGAFGNNTSITEGDLVVFQFDVYKEYWGIHSFDALRAWVDTDQDGTYNDESVFKQGQVNFNHDNPYETGEQSWYVDDQNHWARYWVGEKDGYVFNGEDRVLSGLHTYFTSDAITATAGTLNLRARVTCSSDGLGAGAFPDLPDNWNNLQPTGYLWQGEVEDVQITVSKKVPEPGSLSLMLVGLLSMGGALFFRRKKN